MNEPYAQETPPAPHHHGGDAEKPQGAHGEARREPAALRIRTAIRNARERAIDITVLNNQLREAMNRLLLELEVLLECEAAEPEHLRALINRLTHNQTIRGQLEASGIRLKVDSITSAAWDGLHPFARCAAAPTSRPETPAPLVHLPPPRRETMQPSA